MRARRPVLVALAGLACVAAFLAQGGEPADPRGGPPPPRAFHSACRGKPGIALGEASAVVIERPYLDVAVVRVDWRRGPQGEGCCLEALLPAGCTLEEGEGEHPLPDGQAAGAFTLRIRHPLDCTSDLTLRFCARLGEAEVRRESYVRLWEVLP